MRQWFYTLFYPRVIIFPTFDLEHFNYVVMTLQVNSGVLNLNNTNGFVSDFIQESTNRVG